MCSCRLRGAREPPPHWRVKGLVNVCPTADLVNRQWLRRRYNIPLCVVLFPVLPFFSISWKGRGTLLVLLRFETSVVKPMVSHFVFLPRLLSGVLFVFCALEMAGERYSFVMNRQVSRRRYPALSHSFCCLCPRMNGRGSRNSSTASL